MIHDIGQITQEKLVEYINTKDSTISLIIKHDSFNESYLRELGNLQHQLRAENDDKADLLIVSPDIKKNLDDYVSSLPSQSPITLPDRRTVAIYNTGYSQPWVTVNKSWTVSAALLTTKEAVVNNPTSYPALYMEFSSL